MLKFFFYLKPVDEDSGPHVYVRGSHNHRALRHQITRTVWHSTADVLRVYGEDSAITLLGDAGFGFAEDPFGFHIGMPPKNKARLMLEIAFGVSAFKQIAYM